MSQFLMTIKAKIGKCTYKIEMDKQPSYQDIIQEVATQQEVEPKQVEILEIKLASKIIYWISNPKTFETNLEGLPDFSTQYTQSPH